MPLGVAGELYIAGACLARGYLGRPELTEQRFVADPAAGGVLYRTGDQARWLADGQIEYLGRNDFQVKIRGFRVELGEIESALGLHPQVRDGVVAARANALGELRLVAYVVGAASGAQLRSHLGELLPEYMVPTAFVQLDALPLTPNGKVDRRALPAPDFAGEQSDHVAPRTAAEQRLCALWQDVLGIERVGVTDNFFHLGGDSLSSVRVLAAVRMQFGVSLSLQMVFADPTVASVAASVDALSLNNNNDSIAIADDLMEEGVF